MYSLKMCTQEELWSSGTKLKPPDISAVLLIYGLVFSPPALSSVEGCIASVRSGDLPTALTTEHHKLVRECPGGVLQCIQAQWMAALLQHTAASLQYLQVYKSTVCPVCVIVISRQQQDKQQLLPMAYEPAAPPLLPLILVLPVTMAATSVIIGALPPTLNFTGYYRHSLHQRPPVYNLSDDFLHICVFASSLYFLCVMIFWQKQQQVAATFKAPALPLPSKIQHCRYLQSSSIVHML